MASQVFPKRAAAFSFYVALTSQADTKLFQANPTLAAGDVKVSIDGGAFANVTDIPVVTPAAGRLVAVTLTAAEMTGDNIQVQFVDAAGAEWCDLVVNIQTTVRQVDDLAFPLTTGRGILLDASGFVDVINLQTGAITDVTTGVNAALNAIVADSVPADGTRPTMAQALYMIIQFLTERSIAGATMTVNKVDGTTALMTFTLNDAANPTAITRAT